MNFMTEKLKEKMMNVLKQKEINEMHIIKIHENCYKNHTRCKNSRKEATWIIKHSFIKSKNVKYNLVISIEIQKN